MTQMFKLVCDMNEAFGNAKGDPLNVHGPSLASQCKNIGSEFKELMREFGVEVTIDYVKSGLMSDTLDGVRDALCDIMVFALGAYHRMGYDAEQDMTAVVEALYTRFCRDEEHLRATAAHYTALGIEFYTEGVFPQVCLKSARDQGDGEYPKGKFLKALGYSQPTFYRVLPPVKLDWDLIMSETRAQRDASMANEQAIRKSIDEAVEQYRNQLERGLLGLPHFTDKQGNHHEFNMAVPA